MNVSVYLIVDHHGRSRLVRRRPERVPGEWVWRLIVDVPKPPPIPEVAISGADQPDLPLTVAVPIPPPVDVEADG